MNASNPPPATSPQSPIATNFRENALCPFLSGVQNALSLSLSPRLLAFARYRDKPLHTSVYQGGGP